MLSLLVRKKRLNYKYLIIRNEVTNIVDAEYATVTVTIDNVLAQETNLQHQIHKVVVIVFLFTFTFHFTIAFGSSHETFSSFLAKRSGALEEDSTT